MSRATESAAKAAELDQIGVYAALAVPPCARPSCKPVRGAPMTPRTSMGVACVTALPPGPLQSLVDSLTQLIESVRFTLNG